MTTRWRLFLLLPPRSTGNTPLLRLKGVAAAAPALQRIQIEAYLNARETAAWTKHYGGPYGATAVVVKSIPL